MKTIMRIVTVLVLLCFSIVLVQPTIGQTQCLAEQRDWYVAVNGDDENNGTFEYPLKTIQLACDQLMPGDTLYIMAGAYEQKFAVENSGLADNMITIKPYENAEVILDGTYLNGARMVEIKNQSYVRIEGLIISNSQTDNNEHVPMGIYIRGSGEYIEIISNTINNIHARGSESKYNAHGIAVYGNDKEPLRNITIENNHIYDCTLGSSEALVVNGNVDGFRIVNNNVHDVDNIGIDCIGFEGVSKEGIDQARNGLVAYNTVYNIDSANNPAYGGVGAADGIYVDGGRDIVIESNTVSACNIGIEVASENKGKQTENVSVFNNIVTNCDLYGIAIGGSGKENGQAVNCLIANNTLYANDVTIAVQEAKDNIISSNIFYGGDGELVRANLEDNMFENNIWYSEEDEYKEIWMFVFADPLFIEPQQENYQIMPLSPAIAGGNDRITAITDVDYFGNDRSVETIDCGAIEMPLLREEVDKLLESTDEVKPEEKDLKENEQDARVEKEQEIRVDRSWFYTIQTQGNSDTYGELIRKNGKIIKVDDDSGFELNFLITHWLWKNQPYTIVVESDSKQTVNIEVERINIFK